MKTVPLSPSLPSRESTLERSEEAVLMGEIAERLVEWADLRGRDRPARWLMRVSALAADRDSLLAWQTYMRLASGDAGQLTASFSQMGAARAASKQAEQQEQERALRVIARHFPELRAAVDELLRKGNVPTQPRET